jgi:hypothetical protein
MLWNLLLLVVKLACKILSILNIILDKLTLPLVKLIYCQRSIGVEYALRLSTVNYYQLPPFTLNNHAYSTPIDASSADDLEPSFWVTENALESTFTSS